MEHKLLPTHDLGIYVHVPFCIRKCRYCDFYSVANYDATMVSHSISNILHQLVWYFTRVEGPMVSTLYIGGGTPGSIGISGTEELFQGIRSILGHNMLESCEITVEANPESLTEELLQTYMLAGVNRLSIGVQTFNERLFAVIGRAGSPKRTLDALDMIKQVWPGALSLDLMSALPGQRDSDGIEDLRRLLSFAPDHVSLYTLTIAPGTPLHDELADGKVEAPGDAQTAVWQHQARMLEEAGYRQYEISNFARPGHESRHNLRYWRLEPYLGCGPAAASTLPGTNGPLRIENPTLERYMRTYGSASGHGERFEEIDAKTFFLEHLIVGLRLTGGVEIPRLKRIFGVDPRVPIADTLEKWKGMADCTHGRLGLTSQGRMFLDRFLADVASELDNHDFAGCRWPLTPHT